MSCADPRPDARDSEFAPDAGEEGSIPWRLLRGLCASGVAAAVGGAAEAEAAEGAPEGDGGGVGSWGPMMSRGDPAAMTAGAAADTTESEEPGKRPEDSKGCAEDGERLGCAAEWLEGVEAAMGRVGPLTCGEG